MASLIYRCSLPLYFLGFAPSSASLSVALISIRVNLIIFIVLTLLTELLGSKSPPAISRETAGHPPAVVHLRSTQGEADPEEKRLQPSVCCAETPLQLPCEAGGDLRANLGALEASPGTPRELEDGSRQTPAPSTTVIPIPNLCPSVPSYCQALVLAGFEFFLPRRQRAACSHEQGDGGFRSLRDLPKHCLQRDLAARCRAQRGTRGSESSLLPQGRPASIHVCPYIQKIRIWCIQGDLFSITG